MFPTAVSPLQRAAPMTRFVSVCAAVGLLISAGAAQAEETGMLPNGAHITFERIRINKDGQTPAVEVTDPEVLRRYLNLAHCTCSQAGAGNEQEINYEVRLSNVGGPTVWYSDALGHKASPTPFTGSIRQVISAVNRTFGVDGNGVVIGDRDYSAPGVRSPN